MCGGGVLGYLPHCAMDWSVDETFPGLTGHSCFLYYLILACNSADPDETVAFWVIFQSIRLGVSSIECVNYLKSVLELYTVRNMSQTKKADS